MPVNIKVCFHFTIIITISVFFKPATIEICFCRFSSEILLFLNEGEFI